MSQEGYFSMVGDEFEATKKAWDAVVGNHAALSYESLRISTSIGDRKRIKASNGRGGRIGPRSYRGKTRFRIGSRHPDGGGAFYSIFNRHVHQLVCPIAGGLFANRHGWVDVRYGVYDVTERQIPDFHDPHDSRYLVGYRSGRGDRGICCEWACYPHRVVRPWPDRHLGRGLWGIGVFLWGTP